MPINGVASSIEIELFARSLSRNSTVADMTPVVESLSIVEYVTKAFVDCLAQSFTSFQLKSKERERERE